MLKPQRSSVHLLFYAIIFNSTAEKFNLYDYKTSLVLAKEYGIQEKCFGMCLKF